MVFDLEGKEDDDFIDFDKNFEYVIGKMKDKINIIKKGIVEE
jgi:hypothetical protein